MWHVYNVYNVYNNSTTRGCCLPQSRPILDDKAERKEKSQLSREGYGMHVIQSGRIVPGFMVLRAEGISGPRRLHVLE